MNKCVHSHNGICTNFLMNENKGQLIQCAGIRESSMKICKCHEEEYECAWCGRIIGIDPEDGWENPDGTENSYICNSCMEGDTRFGKLAELKETQKI